MRNGWDSNRWDENWEEPYFTRKERMLDQAERSLDADPTLGYGLGNSRNYIAFEKSEEEKAYDRKRRISRGRYRRSTYKVFTREEAIKLSLIKG